MMESLTRKADPSAALTAASATMTITGASAAPSRDISVCTGVVAAQCRICDDQGLQSVIDTREMMYGTREPFRYFQCRACGCLQIQEIANDLGRHYRTDYYSLKADHGVYYRNRLKNAVNRWRDVMTLFAPFGSQLPFKVKVPHIAASFDALRAAPNLSRNASFLDVGCGSGQLLHRMHNAGFRHLTGVDPFIATDHRVSDRLSLLKRSLEDVEGQFDIILLNHSFEHVVDPIATARQVRERMADDGIAIIRIPLVDSQAWEEYGADWFQLDAPRHLHLHTKTSMAVVAARASLTILKTVYDSEPEQFSVSERYRRGLAMMPTAADSQQAPFELTEAQQHVYRKRAKELNAAQRGDQAAFYLVKS